MSAATMTKMPPTISLIPKTRVRKRITMDEFNNRYALRRDGYKYEFQFGQVIKTQSVMNPDILYLIRKLLAVFYKTEAFRQNSLLVPETNTQTSEEQTRRPDMSLYTDEQIRIARDKTTVVVPAFVVEIISANDKLLDVGTKLIEYFDAGVQVYWQIIPQLSTVYVYTSIDNATVCRGEKICSAAPVMPDFEITPKELFS
jgi:Uma2 family endonuclease